jgi:2-polyprenyl-3-methyl-5-hydroxy-6-metoxy-1,4-benzoquinol methylase
MKCYLCKSNSFTLRKGQVRDAPDLKIMECDDCGLTTLSSLEHIQEGFYENSGMHDEPQTMEFWLNNSEWDDQRRFDNMKALLPNKKLLDFGCGAGGFLKKAEQLAESVEGVELEHRVEEYWRDQLTIHTSIESAGEGYDLITAFHVVEHLSDPVALINILAEKLSHNGRLVIEVPSSEDALLTLYDSDAFQHFTYWSQHLFLFNADNLRKLINLAGLRVINIEQYQRYPLSNHLHWLSKGKPGGHQKWAFLDSSELKTAYANALAAIAKCDTLIAHIELAN